jgi:DNA polymerase-3 subunit epsilon
MLDFIAIDFETANGHPSSVCSVGVVIVRGGEVVNSFYSLIHPYPDYYSWFCQQVHGLGPCDTDDAPQFPEVWDQVVDRVLAAFELEDLPADASFIAHNARFDEGCLRAVHAAYGLRYPDYHFEDTLRASRRHFGCRLPNHQLQTVAAACGYDLTRHHHALADAEACAAIALQLL